MPQLDPATFSPQIVWLVISFAALYILMARVILPRVSNVLAQREDRIQGNLQRAERLREEAAGVLAAYEKAIAEARQRAHADLLKTAADIAAETARREGEFGRKLAEEGAAAEARIRDAKTRAMAEIQSVAGEVAAAMAAKLTGGAIDAGQARQAVEQAIKDRP